MGLLVIDAHLTKKQLRVQSQCKWAASSHLWSNDDLATLRDLVLQHLSFGKLLLLVRGEPDVRKRALLEEEVLGKKVVWIAGGAVAVMREGLSCLRRRVAGR